VRQPIVNRSKDVRPTNEGLPCHLHDAPFAADLSTEAWQRLEAVLRSFEDAWQRGQRPRLADYLPADGQERHGLLVELAHEDLDYRLGDGQAARVEDYLAATRSWRPTASAVLGLIAAEYELRRQREPGCAAAEYLQRFPQYGRPNCPAD